MGTSYDLLTEPWLEVRISADGKLRTVGLRELFERAHEFADVEVSIPPAAAGLWRILYALAARISGLDAYPESLAEWQDLRRQVLAAGRFEPSEVAAYFERHSGGFDLAGVRPFLQDPRLAQECKATSGVNKLVFARPSGSNFAWWMHTDDAGARPLEPRLAAWWLIAQLYYGASGQCTPRTSSGATYPNTPAGPLRAAISYHPLGRNLFESLVLGVPAPPDADDDSDQADLCPWETTPGDPLVPRGPVTWPGGLLTGRFSHAALLVWSPDAANVVDAYVTWALRRPVEAVDPYVVRNLSQQGTFYNRPASADRALWRDLDALLREGDDGSRPPSVFNDPGTLPRSVRTAVRVRAFGFDQDGQATDRQYFTAVTPPVFRYADERTAAWVRKCRVAAEKTGRQLAFAAATAWAESAASLGAKPDQARKGPWSSRALAVYWPAAEARFWSLVNAPADDLDPYRAFVIEAVRALESAVGHAAAAQRGAKALSHASALLWKIAARPAERHEEMKATS